MFFDNIKKFWICPDCSSLVLYTFEKLPNGHLYSVAGYGICEKCNEEKMTLEKGPWVIQTDNF